MLQELKNFSPQRMGIDELVELSVYNDALKAKYESLEIEVPEMIEQTAKQIDRELKTKIAERLEARIRDTKLRLDSLKTPGEKRRQLESELAKLTAKQKKL